MTSSLNLPYSAGVFLFWPDVYVTRNLHLNELDLALRISTGIFMSVCGIILFIFNGMLAKAAWPRRGYGADYFYFLLSLMCLSNCCQLVGHSASGIVTLIFGRGVTVSVIFNFAVYPGQIMNVLLNTAITFHRLFYTLFPFHVRRVPEVILKGFMVLMWILFVVIFVLTVYPDGSFIFCPEDFKFHNLNGNFAPMSMIYLIYSYNNYYVLTFNCSPYLVVIAVLFARRRVKTAKKEVRITLQLVLIMFVTAVAIFIWEIVEPRMPKHTLVEFMSYEMNVVICGLDAVVFFIFNRSMRRSMLEMGRSSEVVNIQKQSVSNGSVRGRK